MLLRFSLFLLINSAALGVGGIFTNTGVNSDWYYNLDKAPWTPPGWFFGVAWTSIMICLAIYMAYAWKAVKNKPSLATIFIVQIVLNILWNPVFFYFQNVVLGLITITSLTILIGWMMFIFKKEMGTKTLLLFPYFIWLIIATSLNAYILLMN
jgi:benzodiazapine receptor